jgi:hypothetical protein
MKSPYGLVFAEVVCIAGENVSRNQIILLLKYLLLVERLSLLAFGRLGPKLLLELLLVVSVFGFLGADVRCGLPCP